MQVCSASAANAGTAWGRGRQPPSADVVHSGGSVYERLGLNAVPVVDTRGRKQAMNLITHACHIWLMHGM
jgi:hypothetical protein